MPFLLFFVIILHPDIQYVKQIYVYIFKNIKQSVNKVFKCPMLGTLKSAILNIHFDISLFMDFRNIKHYY